MHREDFPAVSASWSQVLRSASLYEVQERIRRFDGEYRCFLRRARPTRAGDGLIDKWVGYLTEVHNTVDVWPPTTKPVKIFPKMFEQQLLRFSQSIEMAPSLWPRVTSLEQIRKRATRHWSRPLPKMAATYSASDWFAICRRHRHRSSVRTYSLNGVSPHARRRLASAQGQSGDGGYQCQGSKISNAV